MQPPTAQVKFVFVDETSDTTSTTLHVPRATPASVALGAGASQAGRMAAISGCAVREVLVIYSERFEPVPTAIAPTNPLGAFFFTCTGNDQWAIITLPGLLPGYIVQDTIDTDNPDVQSFISSLQSGIWCNPFVSDIVELYSAYPQYRVNGPIFIPWHI